MKSDVKPSSVGASLRRWACPFLSIKVLRLDGVLVWLAAVLFLSAVGSDPIRSMSTRYMASVAGEPSAAVRGVRSHPPSLRVARTRPLPTAGTSASEAS